jgi:hypothetical protein
MKFMRTCQECGNKQVELHPPTYGVEPSNAYKDRKCKKCKSESLDYGSEFPDTLEEIEEARKNFEAFENE